MIAWPNAATVGVLSLFLIIGILPIVLLVSDSLLGGGTINSGALLGLLNGSRHLSLILNTISLASATTLFCILLGVPLAFLVCKTDLPLKWLFILGFACLLVMPPYISAIAWIDLLGAGGYLKLTLEGLIGGSPEIFGFWGAAFVLTMSLFPLVFFLSYAAFSLISSSLEEAAYLSKGKEGAILGVILPLATEGILFGALLVFIFTISDFGVTSFLTYDTFAMDIYSRLESFYDVRSATAYSLVLTAMSLAVVLVYSKTLARKSYTSISGVSAAKLMMLRGWKTPAFAFSSSVLLVSLVLPLASLAHTAAYSFVGPERANNFVLALRMAAPNIKNSVIFSALGSTAAWAIGYCLASLSRRMAEHWRRAIESTLLLPFIMPGTIFALGLIQMWNFPKSPIYNTYLMIVVGYVAKFTVVSYKAAQMALDKISPSLQDASLISGASRLQVLRRITLPLAAPGLACGWLITYVLCMGELNNSLMVYPPGNATLPISLYILQHGGPPGLVAALAIITLAVTAFPLLLVSLLIWTGRTSHG
jgi:iron(III) transport system permease protein